jgi:hypothetical protein
VLSSKDFLEKLSIRGTYGLPKEEMPAGRAFFPRQNRVDNIVQTALVADPEALVEQINQKWKQAAAAWENPASDDRIIREATIYLKTDDRASRKAGSDDDDKEGGGMGAIDVAGLLADFGLISSEGGKDDQ